jgi:hypothetical protein
MGAGSGHPGRGHGDNPELVERTVGIRSGHHGSDDTGKITRGLTGYKLVFCSIVLAGLFSRCSNDSGPNGPETLPVELNVTAQGMFNGVPGASVMVFNQRPGDPPANLTAVTDTGGVAHFATNINVLLPNHVYKIIVPEHGGWIQAYPNRDTLVIPSQPNIPNGYLLEQTVQMKIKGD